MKLADLLRPVAASLSLALYEQGEILDPALSTSFCQPLSSHLKQYTD